MLKAYLDSTRPNTLFLAMASMLCGNVLAWAFAVEFSFLVAFFCFTTALGLQVVSNLANDYGDGVKGVDDKRIGPVRSLASGQLTHKQLIFMMVAVVLLTLISGVLLLWVSGLTVSQFYLFMLIGLLALIAAFTYTIGKHPYGYYAAGELSVIVFFGLVGVCGSFYLQAHQLKAYILLPAIGCGLLSAAVLNTNNMRDRINDQAVKKITLAVLLGATGAKYFHLGLVGFAWSGYLLFAVFYVPSTLIILIVLPMTYKHIGRVLKAGAAIEFAPELKSLVTQTLFINVLFAVGLIIGN